MAFLQEGLPATVFAKVKPSDESIDTSTTLQNDDDFSLYVEPGETWIIEYNLFTTFDTAGQISVAVTVPTGSTLVADSVMTSDNAAVVRGYSETSGEAMDLVVTDAVAGSIKIKAVVTAAIQGFVNLQWAQETSDAGATTVLANSYMTATKI